MRKILVLLSHYLDNGTTEIGFVNYGVLALLSCIILVTLIYIDSCMVIELYAGEI